MSDNGKIDTEVAAVLGAGALADGVKIRVDPDSLTPRDLRRARTVLSGRNPFELLDDPLDRVVLTIWCLVSRDDPSFTWDQAEDMPFSRLDTAGEDAEPDPPIAPGGSLGRGAARSAAKPSRRKPPADATAPN
jgi:hypothetical protein